MDCSGIIIESVNYDGELANIIFTPDNQDISINLGDVVLPFFFEPCNLIPPRERFGFYTILTYNPRCTNFLRVPRPTPTPTPTPSPTRTCTPTPTPTITPTPTFDPCKLPSPTPTPTNTPTPTPTISLSPTPTPTFDPCKATPLPTPLCPESILVIQICNSNSAKDDNFNVYLNNVYIGYLDLSQNAQVGSIFIGIQNTSYNVTQPDFTCPLSGMVSYWFNGQGILVQGTNFIEMQNAQQNNNGNFGVVQVRNYEFLGYNLINPCFVANLQYSGPTGANFTLPFNYQGCCPSPTPTVTPTPTITPTVTPTPTPTPTTSPPAALSCICYQDGSNLGTVDVYDINTNSFSQITLPNDTFTNFANTHNQYKYWKGDQVNKIIKEWSTTTNPTLLSYDRTITITVTIPGINWLFNLVAVNDTTLLTSDFVPLGTCHIYEMDITTNTVGPSEFTQLFPLTSTSPADSMCFTTTNKLLVVSRRDIIGTPNVSFLQQYDYPSGNLDVDISLLSLGTPTNNLRFDVFEESGNIYISRMDPSGTTIFSVGLTSPYTFTQIVASTGTQYGVWNGSKHCSTVNF